MPAGSLQTPAARLIVTEPCAPGVTFTVKVVLSVVAGSLTVPPVLTAISLAVNVLLSIGSLKVIVIGMLVLVGFGAVELKDNTSGAVMSYVLEKVAEEELGTEVPFWLHTPAGTVASIGP